MSITVDDARTLNGKRVRVSFVTGKPSYALNGVTVTGPADPEQDGEDVSRGVVLRGETIIDPGERVEVVGQLRVRPVSLVLRPTGYMLRITQQRQTGDPATLTRFESGLGSGAGGDRTRVLASPLPEGTIRWLPESPSEVHV